MERNMKDMTAYLKMNKKGIVLMALWIAVFLTVFALSDLPLGAVKYGLLLFSVIGGIYVILDYRRFSILRPRNMWVWCCSICASVIWARI